METIYCYRMGPAVYRILCLESGGCNAPCETGRKYSDLPLGGALFGQCIFF